MKKTLQLILMCLFVMAGTQAQTAKNEGFGIYGFIGDHVTHAGLGEVKVKLMRPDSTVIDSMQVNPNMSISGLKPVWCFNIYQEGNYLLYFTHPGYEPKYVQVGVKNVGRREYIRKYPPVYLQRRMKEGGEYLVGWQGGRLSTTQFRTQWKAAMGSLKISKTPHECRHTFESLLDSAGANRKCIDMMMGHVSKDTGNRIYNHKTVDELRRNLELVARN